MRISIETRDRGLEAAPHAAGLMAQVVGWDDATTAAEVEIYRECVAAGRRSQERADDLERTSAPDVPARRVGDRAGVSPR